MGHEIGVRTVIAPTFEQLRKKVGEVEEKSQQQYRTSMALAITIIIR